MMKQGRADVSRWPVREVLGARINDMRMNDVVKLADECIQSRCDLLIGVVNAAKVVHMRRNPQLDEAVGSADVTVADGMAVVWAAKLLCQPLPERIAGIDLMFRLLELANRNRYRVYCLGATDEVLAKVVAQIGRDYPNAIVAGQQNGYFKPEDEMSIAKAIGASNADMLFVAISPPKKEQFLARWAEYLNTPVCHGVGGSFDVMAGKVKRAPVLWQKLGMEWLYRVLQEPRRMWRRYLITNTLFVWMLGRELLVGKRSKVSSTQRDTVTTR